MDNDIKYFRFVWSKWMPFLSGIVFIWIFYLFYFVWWSKEPLKISSYWVSEFAWKYGVFIPLVYALISIVTLYIFYLLKWIVRLNFWFINLILLLIVYWFNLFLWVQLVYFEPRYTDVAIFIIDTFSKPIMYASIWSLIFILISIFIKKKV